MEIREYFSLEEKEYWLEQIKKSDWGAGQFLYEILSNHTFKELCGKTSKVYLLTDNRQLVSFCTLAEEDDVRDTGLGPWIGFVYTFPEFRGHRNVGKLLTFACQEVKDSDAEYIYISTGEEGLYEKYGYSFYQMMKDMHGEDSRIYRKKIRSV